MKRLKVAVFLVGLCFFSIFSFHDTPCFSLDKGGILKSFSLMPVLFKPDRFRKSKIKQEYLLKRYCLEALEDIEREDKEGSDFYLDTPYYKVRVSCLGKANEGIIFIEDSIYKFITMSFNKETGAIVKYSRISSDELHELLPGEEGYREALNKMLRSLDGYYKYFSLESVVFGLIESVAFHDSINNLYVDVAGLSFGVTNLESANNGFIFIEDTANNISMSLNKESKMIFKYSEKGRKELFFENDAGAYVQALASMKAIFKEQQKKEIEPFRKEQLQLVADYLNAMEVDASAHMRAHSIVGMKIDDAFEVMLFLFLDDWKLFSETFGALCEEDAVFSARLFEELLNAEMGPIGGFGPEYRSWEEQFVMMSYALPRGGVTYEELSLLLSAKDDNDEYIVSTDTAVSFFFNWVRADGGQTSWAKAVAPFIGCNRAGELLPELHEKWTDRRTVTQWRIVDIFGEENLSWRQFFEDSEESTLGDSSNRILVFKSSFEELIEQSDISETKKELLFDIWQDSCKGDPLKDQFFISLIGIIQEKDNPLKDTASEVLDECINLNIVSLDPAVDLTRERTEFQWKQVALTADTSFTRAAALSQINDEEFLFNYVFKEEALKGYVFDRGISDVEFAGILTTGLTQNWYDRLDNKEERKFYIQKIIVVDTTNFKPYISTGSSRRMNYICIDFSFQLWMNGTGGDVTVDAPDFLERNSVPCYSYGLPIHTVDVEHTHIDHAINVVFVGDDINDIVQVQDWGNWVFIEPATDEVPEPIKLEARGPVYGILPYGADIEIAPATEPLNAFVTTYELLIIFHLDENNGFISVVDKAS